MDKDMVLAPHFEPDGPGAPSGPAAMVIKARKLPSPDQALREAIRRRRRVAFVYQGAKDSKPYWRHVEPLAAVHFADRVYLYGFDLHRDAPRIFRLDRIGVVRPGHRRFQPKTTREPLEAVAEAITGRTAGFAASVLVPGDGPGAWEPGRVSFAWRRERAQDPPGWVRLVLLMDDDADRALAALARLPGEWILESQGLLADRLAALASNAEATRRFQAGLSRASRSS
ncbi:MAG: WYL domain-containing protein [Bifidobacteriaceae bacterium]|jgi:predicted DNA-binding transcriptional regulator YafY|nr:WYL domain-containing protein [Bifidobacteriaceae bacterium]